MCTNLLRLGKGKGRGAPALYNPTDAVFIAIHPDFYSAETYLLAGLEFPRRVISGSQQVPKMQ
jgi:hypothetical protein